MCGSDKQRGHSGDGCLSSSMLFKYKSSRGHLYVLSWARSTTGCSGECCFRVMYGEWHGVYDCAVLSVVEVVV